MKKLKTIPKFKNEKEEFSFWATHDSTEYVDYSKSEVVRFPSLNHQHGTSLSGFLRRS